MALIPLVMINGTIKKYEIKKTTRFTWKPLREKTTGRGESLTMNFLERLQKFNIMENKP